MLFGNRKKHHGNRPNHRVLRTEVLEERALLSAVPLSSEEYAEITAQYSDFNLPDTSADLNIITLDLSEGDDLSDLKSAIATAGTTTESDLIVIRTSETTNTITYAAVADEITIDIDATQFGSITLIGLGDENFTLDANQLCRVMTVSGTKTVANLGGLTITDGYRISHGGGIYVGTSSTLTLDDCLVDGNQTYGSSDYGGAGIYSLGNVTVQNSTISANVAKGNGGGIYNYSGTLTVTNSTISNNTAESTGGGIYSNGTTMLTDVTISGNSAFGTYSNGGGIYSSGTTKLTDVTISNNKASYGGGISSSGTTTLSGVTISNNTATNTVTTLGGGIYCSGTTTLTDVTISDNTASRGGGIYCSGTTTLTDVTISDNTASTSGGGIYNYSSKLTITQSEIINNKTTTNSNHSTYGGGIYNTGTATLTNVTIAGNIAQYTGTSTSYKGYGGGVYNYSGTFNAYNTIIRENTANIGGGIDNRSNLNLYQTIIDQNVALTGGGIYVGTDLSETTYLRNCDVVRNRALIGGGLAVKGLVYVYNSIIALNGDETTDGQDVWTYNGDDFRTMAAACLIGNADFTTGKAIYNDGSLTGTAESPLNPGFVDAENGDYTLLSTSIAIDKGNDLLTDLETDYAENVRKQGNQIDIGCYEYAKEVPETLETPSVIVTTGEDVVDAYDGQISLREAIAYAEAGATITFDTTLFANGGTMELSGTNLIIEKDLSIDASDLGDKIILDANGLSRVVWLSNETPTEVTFKNLTITGGYRISHGGGIYVGTSSTLTLDDCLVDGNQTYGSSYYGGAGIYSLGNVTVLNSAISNNKATGYNNRGGGIYNYSGTLTVTNSTISGNTGSYGGGIYSGGATELIGVTISGNTASDDGGGIYNSYGTLTLTDVTISGNTASFGVGGIYNSYGTLTVTNSTISANTAGGIGGGIYSNGTTTLTDVTISGNSASSGGGIYCGGTTTLTDVTISGNTASDDGGGIYNYSSKLTITQSEIINNKATTNSNHSTYGGGIYNSGNGTATLTNVTIAGNIAQYTGTSTSYKGYGGGVYNTSGTFNAYNTIIAGNTANNGNDIYKNSGTINGYHSLSSYTAWGGANNVEYIPEGSLFRSIENGDFRLAPGSQASERGNNQYAYDVGMDETWLDMAGELRFIGDIIDIGAYESSRLDISQWGIYTGNVSLSWVQYKNAENLRLTWVSGTTATVLGLFDSAGEYTWDTTKYADGNGQLKIDYLDENGKVLLTSNIVATILNDANIAVHRGEISADETWNADKVHLVVGKTTVKSGATLVIAENAIVKFWKNAYLNTESGSTLTIQDNVILTRAEDDSIGGDTNKDGVLSVAKMGNAYLRGNGTFDLASTVEMRFVTQTTSGTLSQSETWLSGKVYHVTSTLTVPSGVTLTILPGAVVKFDSGCSLVVKSGGSLVAEGNATQPIIFTSVKDDSYGGDTNEDDGEYGPEAGDWKQIWSTVVVRYSIMQSYDMRGMFLDHKAQFTAVMLRA